MEMHEIEYYGGMKKVIHIHVHANSPRSRTRLLSGEELLDFAAAVGSLEVVVSTDVLLFCVRRGAGGLAAAKKGKGRAIYGGVIGIGAGTYGRKRWGRCAGRSCQGGRTGYRHPHRVRLACVHESN